ncbi:MAG: hypothetical protein MI892_21595 [Desulfobacterales bacterium]|nr:hypothetical protein [Desulfobacterales bacterium]
MYRKNALIKRTLSMVIAIAVALLPSFSTAQEPFKILTVQHQTFIPYQQSLKGFKQGIADSDFASKIELSSYNAKSDIEAMELFIDKVKQKGEVDLIFTIGTRSTKVVTNKIKDIPIVFTDLGAAEASGIVTDWKASGTNYTGVETRNYVSIGINLLHELIAFNSIGMIYLKGSPSHEGTVKKVTELSKKNDFNFITHGFSLRDENRVKYPEEVIRENIKTSLAQVAPKVDVFYVQISNTFHKHFDLFLDAFEKYSVPSAGEPIYIKKGLVIGIGRDKEEFGRQCAEYAVKILNGADPGKLPMDVGKEFSFSLNIEAATLVGYNPSIDILGASDEIYKNIEVKD